MLCTLFLVTSSNAESVVSEADIDPTVGDFFQYEMLGTSLPDGMGKAVDEEKYLRVEDYDGNGFRMEITALGETEFEGETVDYFVMMLSWESNFTLYFDDITDDADDKEDVVEVSVSTNREIWIVDDSGLNQLNSTEIKVVDEERINMNITFNQHDDQTTFWSTTITETETETISSSGDSPEEYKVGSMWTTSTTTRDTGTQRERMCEDGETDGCEWEIEEIDEEETSTTTSEALRGVSLTTSAGTFETLEVKDIDQNEGPGNYTLGYVSETGIPVKMAMYEEGKVVMEMQLESYHISVWETAPGDDDESALGDLPALPFLLSIASIALIAHRNRLQ